MEFETAGAALALHEMSDPARQGLVLRFETDDLAIISEQDILGDRLVRRKKRKRRK